MKTIPVEINGVNFGYEKQHPVLENITFTARAGESIGLIGANGAGKSTLLKMLVGLNSDFHGEIQVNGYEMTKENLSRIRERTGYVFQDSESQLFMSTAYEDIAFGPKNYGYSKAKIDQMVQQALVLTDIEHLRDKQIYKLSGGEKKLVSIATILSMEPDIIILDEPSIALDPKNRRNLIHILNGLKQLKIIASHDLDMVLDTCSRTILLSQGKIIKDGATGEILADQELLEENGLELPLCMQGRIKHQGGFVSCK